MNLNYGCDSQSITVTDNEIITVNNRENINGIAVYV